MQYADGSSWRSYVSNTLTRLNIVCFNPYDKPFVKDIEEGEEARKEMHDWLNNSEYDKVSNKMREIRSYDLNLVDRSDFIISHIDPSIASWGSAEEIVTAVRMKKPIFLSIEGGKNKVPLWILGMIPHKYIYNNLDEILDVIDSIDSGKKHIDSDRWRLLKKKYR
jgi:hypothetical protein